MASVNGTYYNYFIPPAPQGSARLDIPIFTETFTPGSTNDTRRLLKVPINIVFTADTFFQVSDMDTGTPALVMTLRVTDGTTTKVLIHQSTAGQAGGLARPTKIPATENAIGWCTDNVNYWVELLIDTQAATAASGTFVYGIGMTGYAPSGMKH